jgi:hypothetical protein
MAIIRVNSIWHGLVLTDNGIQFCDLPSRRNGPTARLRMHMFDRIFGETAGIIARAADEGCPNLWRARGRGAQADRRRQIARWSSITEDLRHLPRRSCVFLSLRGSAYVPVSLPDRDPRFVERLIGARLTFQSFRRVVVTAGIGDVDDDCAENNALGHIGGQSRQWYRDPLQA